MMSFFLFVSHDIDLCESQTPNSDNKLQIANEMEILALRRGEVRRC